eukprot:bmy_01034T0
MVDKLVLLESSPFILETNELENMLTYKRRAIEHVLQVEASKKPSQVVSPEEMLQGWVPAGETGIVRGLGELWTTEGGNLWGTEEASFSYSQIHSKPASLCAHLALLSRPSWGFTCILPTL